MKDYKYSMFIDLMGGQITHSMRSNSKPDLLLFLEKYDCEGATLSLVLRNSQCVRFGNDVYKELKEN